MSDRSPFRALDPEGVADGDYVVTVAGGVVTGLKPAAAGGGGGAIAVDDEGAEVVAAASRLNFTGAGVTVSDSGSGEVQVAIPGGGGGGGGWATALDLPLTTAAGFTAVGGSWSADANGIRQSATASGPYRLIYVPSSPLALTEIVAQVELKVAASASGHVGLLFGLSTTTPPNGAPMAGFTVAADGSIPSVYCEQDSQVALGTVPLAAAIAANTWTTLKVARRGETFDIYVNGALISSWGIGYNAVQRYVGLKSYKTDVTFRNLKLWTPDLPA